MENRHASSARQIPFGSWRNLDWFDIRQQPSITTMRVGLAVAAGLYTGAG